MLIVNFRLTQVPASVSGRVSLIAKPVQYVAEARRLEPGFCRVTSGRAAGHTSSATNTTLETPVWTRIKDLSQLSASVSDPRQLFDYTTTRTNAWPLVGIVTSPPQCVTLVTYMTT